MESLTPIVQYAYLHPLKILEEVMDDNRKDQHEPGSTDSPALTPIKEEVVSKDLRSYFFGKGKLLFDEPDTLPIIWVKVQPTRNDCMIKTTTRKNIQPTVAQSSPKKQCQPIKRRKNSFVERKVPCRSCDRKFVTVEDMKIHAATHLRKRKKDCFVCGRRFNHGENSIFKMDSEKRAVSEIISSKHFRELTKQVIIRLAKNNTASEMIRKQGNDYFNNKIHNAQEHEDAWKLYSMSAAVAENGSESLALSYSNRSIILLHMCKFEQSIVDINRALHITKNDCLRVKLLLRKVKCMHALNDDESHSVLKEVRSSVKKITIPALKDKFEKDIKEIEFMLKMPQFHVESNNKKHDMLSALKKKHSVNDFSSVEIQSNDKYGRYLTATKDIEPGEVIYIEKPYIRCLNIKKLHAYCSHCFKTTWTNIPCDNCSWTMFCSEECKEDAWQKYHDIECSVYACAKDDEGNDTSKQMALRAMILALKEYGSIKKLEAQLLKWDESTDNKEAFLENGKVKGNGFKSMYMMSGHVTPKLFKKHKKDTGRVLRSLGKNASFFGNDFDYSNVESYKNNENVLFLGALFLRLSKISDINSFQMWNDSYKCRNNLDLNFMCWMNECCTRGVYIAPITSLLNHSCSPNANRCYSDNHKVILYAVQPIKKGAQIFHSYQEIYYKCPTNLRREFLSHMYNFSCECAACQGNWQEYNDLHVLSNEISKNPAAMLEFKSEFGYVIDSVTSGRCNYDEKIIDKLKSGIEKSLVTLRQPSIFTIELIKCLSIIFEKFYGIWLHIPDECNPV